MHKKEVSDNIENTLRQAARSTDLYNYLQNQYKWEDNTIASIDWIIYGAALQSLSTSQRKSVTQLVHSWLPVQGHPGRSNRQINRNCPHCKDATETQRHFLTCPLNQKQWKKDITSIVEPLLSLYGPLASILQWALQHCQDEDTLFPHDHEGLRNDTIYPQYTMLLKGPIRNWLALNT
jgi:hypothetical protein